MPQHTMVLQTYVSTTEFLLDIWALIQYKDVILLV